MIRTCGVLCCDGRYAVIHASHVDGSSTGTGASTPRGRGLLPLPKGCDCAGIGTPLRWHRDTAIRRQVQVRGNASPFDGHLLYWSQRLKLHPLTGTLVGGLLQRQEGRCAWCQRYFMDGETWDVDHYLPRQLGGSDRSSNRQLLHRHCHHQKTAGDGSQASRGIQDSDHVAEKRNEGKRSRSVLQAGGGERSPSPS